MKKDVIGGMVALSLLTAGGVASEVEYLDLDNLEVSHTGEILTSEAGITVALPEVIEAIRLAGNTGVCGANCEIKAAVVTKEEA